MSSPHVLSTAIISVINIHLISTSSIIYHNEIPRRESASQTAIQTAPLSYAPDIPQYGDPMIAPPQPPPYVPEPTPCLLPACVNPCGPFLTSFDPFGSTTYCDGHPNTECVGYAECNKGCFARYFDKDTNEEITDCILKHGQQLNSGPSIAESPALSAPLKPGKPALTTFSTPIPAECPLPGEQCSSDVPFQDRCCIAGSAYPGSARCKYTDYDGSGNRIGTCCVVAGREGCTQDSDCCDGSRQCYDGYCWRQIDIMRNQQGQSAGDAVFSKVDDEENTSEVDKDNKYMLIGFTTASMVWMSFILIWLTACSVFFWCRKEKQNLTQFVDNIASQTRDSYEYEVEQTPAPVNL